MSRIAIIVKGYPRLSETFIAQEILGLEMRGIRQLIVALRRPYDPYIHETHRRIKADVLYLPEYLKDDPARVAEARKWAQGQPAYEAARALFEADLAHDNSAGRHRRWGQACVLARELPEDVSWIHTHYLHTPCSVARYAAHLSGRKWSFSAHAKDIWTTPERDLRTKIDDAAWGVTCTRANAEYLNSLSADPGKVSLVYHGLDFSPFPKPNGKAGTADGGKGGEVRILSVGRAVEKKGYDDLLAALAKLPSDIRWHFEHIGGGQLADKLKSRADALGLNGRVTWRGPQPREEVINAAEAADLFVLPSKIARSGDRDGLPNVLMEAQALGLCCLASDVSAIPELITHGETGWLVPPADRNALGKALDHLIRSPDTRKRLGQAASGHVRQAFATDPGLDFLAERFRNLPSTP